jgi:hypothetical protein
VKTVHPFGTRVSSSIGSRIDSISYSFSEKQNGMDLDIACYRWYLQPGKPLKVEGGVLNARSFDPVHHLAHLLCREESRVAFESVLEVAVTCNLCRHIPVRRTCSSRVLTLSRCTYVNYTIQT